MKKLKVKSWENVSGLIFVEADWLQCEYIFLETKNFEIKPIVLPVQRHFLELDDYLNLKQFKVEII